jgi:hypothetical protein
MKKVLKIKLHLLIRKKKSDFLNAQKMDFRIGVLSKKCVFLLFFKKYKNLKKKLKKKLKKG